MLGHLFGFQGIGWSDQYLARKGSAVEGSLWCRCHDCSALVEDQLIKQAATNLWPVKSYKCQFGPMVGHGVGELAHAADRKELQRLWRELLRETTP